MEPDLYDFAGLFIPHIGRLRDETHKGQGIICMHYAGNTSEFRLNSVSNSLYRVFHAKIDKKKRHIWPCGCCRNFYDIFLVS